MALAQESPLGGRIQVIVGPPHAVPDGPTFVAIGDIDNDGINDAAISSPNADQIISALSAGDGTFAALITFPVGRRLGDLVLLPANTDNNLDVASTDSTVSNLGGGVFVSAGSGDGRFGIPTFVEATTRAARIVTADFDNDGDIDIATANGRRVNFQTRDQDISVILNRGQNRGFAPGVGYAIGAQTQPEDIAVADFDSDGDTDIVVLDTDPRNTDEVVLTLNNGLAQFLTVTNFVTGLGGAAMVVDDFNLDGIPDIAVVNDDTSRRLYSLSVLLNRTRSVNGTLFGTGVFDVLPPVGVPCPSSLNGVPITCFMQDLGAGDFNADGVTDLVISIDTRADDDIGVVTPGILSYFEGLGDGSFVSSSQVNVGAGVAGIDVGDVTGDALVDVVVAETRVDTITIVRSVMPPERPNGEPCRIAQQCQSGACVDGVCCETSSCEAPDRCDIPGSEGVCTPPGDNGDRCELGEQCNSGFCVDGFCCSTRNCPSGQFCNTGSCAPPAPPGVPCSADQQCNPPNCVDGFCCTQPDCPVGERCDIPEMEGMCTPRLDLGEPCAADGQCSSNFCTDGVCCQVNDCGPGRACDISPREGFCELLPTPTPTATATPTPQPNGFPCQRPDQCASNFCVDGTCCGTANCPPNQFCNISTENGNCSPRNDIGECCNIDSDCRTINCDFDSPERPQGCNGACAPVRTPTPIGIGGLCDMTSDCQPGLFCNIREGGLCCVELECPAGTSCRVPGSEGLCRALATPTPTRLPNGRPCSANNEQACASGNCVNDVCCQEAACLGIDRCDIFGEEGRCLPPLQAGQPCQTNTDCLPGLQCRNDDGLGFRCTLRDPTATPVPTDPPTATPGNTVVVSRDSGGCAIAATSTSDSNAIWLLLGLPLMVWARPRR
ncbi:MAG TPA: VCBS repeat-containing protein [Terriglobales bacterium]|nr:VCBS repeat-containing protein [Terriglobales bacterium]